MREFSPDFSHQLWDGEEIHLENPNDAGVVIYVLCNKFLEHAAQLYGTISESERYEILKSLEPALPSNVFWAPRSNRVINDHSEFFRQGGDGERWYNSIDAMSSAPGVKVYEFRRGHEKQMQQEQEEEQEQEYELWLANKSDESATHLLTKLEKVAMWFIETADSVNFSEDDRWEVLFCFQKHHNLLTQSITYSVVGYMTLFTFRNPFQGSKLRICQALILPHHQGRGLGRIMMMQVYAIAKERGETSEVTVEDPAPGFQCLRDFVDCEWALQAEFVIEKLSNTSESSLLAKALKITPSQAVFITESFQFASIIPSNADLLPKQHYREAVRVAESSSSSVNENDALESMLQEPAMREFRLSVKRRLLKENSDLKLLTKIDMQKELETLFRLQLKRFLAVLKVTKKAIQDSR